MDTSPQQRLTLAVSGLGGVLGESDASVTVTALTDAELLAGLGLVADARRALDVLTSAFTAEVERRSARDLGYDGLAQRTGHRTGTALIQSVTGQTRIDVRRAVDAGNDLAATRVLATPTTDPAADPDGDGDAAGDEAAWFTPLAEALAAGALSREQYDVIRRGLGEPPVARYPGVDPRVVRERWRELAVRLIAEASEWDVEALATEARLARDTSDPIGTAERYEEHHRRSFRRFTDRDGQQGARILFDDDDAAFIDTVRAAALRPRRGPRFVDATVRAEAAADVADDDRSNEQLEYDTILAIFRTGASADPSQAFGDRQPGVRVITTRQPAHEGVADATGTDAAASGRFGESTDVGIYEETRGAIPLTMVQKYLCDAGMKTITIDTHGTPLDVGREERFFTPKQRDALALRDGGCRWCGAEPSRCEAHHINPWVSMNGRTDLADGILLCRNCRAPRGAVLIGGDVRSLALACRGELEKLRAA